MLHSLIVIWALVLLRCATATKVCPRPQEIQGALYKPEKLVYEPSNFVVYSCLPGFVRQGGYNRAVCSSAGIWIHASLSCARRQCSLSDTLENGDITYENNKFQNVVRFSCKEGFVLIGANSSTCNESGKWNESLPTCQSMTCPQPPVPAFGQLSYYRPDERNVSKYQDMVKYECHSNYAMFGNDTATCTASGNWSQAPECRDVTCDRPPEIQNGFMSVLLHQRYHYKETVTYGCKPNYVLDGPRVSFCNLTGEWTIRPKCRAPCKVNIKKATVLYNGRKTKVDDIAHGMIQHGDTLTYYCKDSKEKCSHLTDSQCQDGVFAVPSCYKEPKWLWSKEPSNLPVCSEAS
ncbi:beta-2-glycoprotein 1 isoform X2 [Xenopus laevis]|uniref:Beta-2-glycoprotein 1 n=2 Tax=Xenopus laevis TaxID=8355 RepID=A0A8J1LTY0_XENLA|nr:beta-2-glycoprotein 1 isoform X2 [Xenopus laevis]